MSYEYKGFIVPVVEQPLHQSCDGGNEGDARLSPRLLLDLLQQAARSMQQITHWKQFKLWGQTHHVPLDILCVSTCESVSTMFYFKKTSKSSTRAINEAKSDVSCFSVTFLSCVVSHDFSIRELTKASLKGRQTHNNVRLADKNSQC